MTDITQPSEAEAQHIGTFWVLNFERSGQGVTEQGRGQAPPVPYTTPDPDPYRVRAGLAPALGSGGVGQAPALGGGVPGQAPALGSGDVPAPAIPNIVPRIPATFMRVRPEDVQELAQAMGPGDTELVLQRFDRGCECYGGRIDGKLVTYGWVTFDKEHIGELGLSFRLQAGEAYIWDCVTLPAFRGQRLYPALLAFMLGELYRAGIRRIWIGADVDNLPSQSGFILAGFTPVVDILMTRHPATRVPWVRGLPGASEEIVADVRRAIFGNS